MKYLRIATVVLLVFGLLVPLFTFIASLLLTPVAEYMAWRENASECLRTQQTAPPFGFSSTLSLLYFSPGLFLLDLPMSLACGIFPAAWTAYRGYLPLSVVILISCIATIAHTNPDNGSWFIDLLFFIAAGFACLFVLRRIGVRSTPPTTPI